MDRSLLRALVCLGTLAGGVNVAFAEVLATFVDTWTDTGALGPPIVVRDAGYRWRVFNVPAPPLIGANSANLWNDLRFGPADVGRSFRLTDADGEPFTTAAIRLSDGVPNVVSLSRDFYYDHPTGGSGAVLGGPGSNDRQLLFGSANPSLPVDLIGYDITAITLRIDEFSLTTQPISTPIVGSSYVYSGRATITVEGVVPEPIFGAILVSIPLVARRRR